MIGTITGRRETQRGTQHGGRGVARRMMRTALLGVCLAAGLSACAAGRFERLPGAVDRVQVGLAPEQIELRVQADAAARTPWKAAAAESDGLSVTNLFSILVDGMKGSDAGAGDAVPGADPEAALALSEPAQAYLAALEAADPERGAALVSLRKHLRKRVKITERFLSAASQVVATHRLDGFDAARADVFEEDRSLIADTRDRLRDQREVFASVAQVLTVRGAAQGISVPGIEASLAELQREIDALEVLARSMPSRPVS